MSVVSIDIGLKTLSLCAMDKNKHVSLWELYNVLESEKFCEGLKKDNTKCSKKASTTTTKVYYCKTHSKGKQTKVYKPKAVKSYTYQEIAKLVISCIQNIQLPTPILSILIELQPKVNQKMKFVSHIVFGFFVQKGYLVRFVRASKKLKEICRADKDTYAKRKKKSIELVQNLLSKGIFTGQLDSLDNTTKKDDLCDVFLMCTDHLRLNLT